MILYVDTSALTRRYVVEPGTVEARDAIARATTVVTSIACAAELVSALARAKLAGRLTEEDAAFALAEFWRDWLDFAHIELSESTVRHAADLAWRYGLRGYDAVHLASALTARELLGEPVTLATYDRQLCQAARLADLPTIPVDMDAWLASLTS